MVPESGQDGGWRDSHCVRNDDMVAEGVRLLVDDMVVEGFDYWSTI